ncbi:DUF4238 domain-containing protein [Photobacterium leiognathi]|uniref:DUF4238 domain-containing protein n=1 Tax=Photobacterium leiognathi TaxID=553611 RepID=UPI000D159B77|nr:DUF4238 domain-containing protein [Photobacterium leiognathi]PSW44811.1 hypothetical protein C0W40_08430 [Photobacterium leiognathi subsp. mandapamensis]
MANSEPKKQHYVPQFLLSNFTQGKKKRLHVFDLKSKKSFVSHVRDVGHENNFYHHSSNGNQMEFALGTIETEVAPIIDQILNEETVANVTDQQREILCYFTLVQILRVNAVREMLTEFSQLMLDEFVDEEVEPNSQAEALLKQLSTANSKETSIDMLWKTPEQLLPHLMNKHLSLLKAPKGDSFLLSDNPVVKYNNLHREGRGNLGLALKGIEVHFPISPRFCLCFLCPEIVQDIRNKVEHHHLEVVLGGKPAQDLTEALKLLNQIDKKTTKTITKEHVIHHNSLQIVHCTRFLYSSKGDYSLVNEMLEYNPNLTNKIRLQKQ